MNVISNGDLLTNIRQIDQYMHIYCNAGKASTNWVGDLDGVGTVWFHKKWNCKHPLIVLGKGTAPSDL